MDEISHGSPDSHGLRKMHRRNEERLIPLKSDQKGLKKLTAQPEKVKSMQKGSERVILSQPQAISQSSTVIHGKS
jgi:hypothetical protein